MVSNDERTRRYADAAAAAWDSGEFPVSDAIARAAIALADAEQDEILAQWERTHGRMAKALAVERAKVARVEAVVNDEFGFTYDAIRAALDGTA